MSGPLIHQMNILPSPSGGYSVRRAGDPSIVKRAVIVPQEDQVRRREPDSRQESSQRRPVYLSQFRQMSPDEFAREALSMRSAKDLETAQGNGAAVADPEEGKAAPQEEKNQATGQKLDEQELAQLRELQARDAEVRAHEAAHLGAAGGLAVSGASYTYTSGPDGQKYATGGEVSIDTSKENTPEKTLDKARKIRAAALAPSNPSSTDLRVAAQASAMAMRASAEIAEATFTELEGDSGSFAASPVGPAETTPEGMAPEPSGVDASREGQRSDKPSLFQRVLSMYGGSSSAAARPPSFLAYA
jgi:hypothetical protein